MVPRMNLRLQIFTIIVGLGVFLSCGGPVPAWCDEDVALKSAETGESSSIAPWTTDYIRKRPYLIYDGKSTTMTVLWQTYQTPAKATLEWGTTTSYGKGPVTVHENGSSPDKHQFSYTISKLHPATRYYFQVTNDTFSHTGSFITAPLSDSATVLLWVWRHPARIPQSPGCPQRRSQRTPLRHGPKPGSAADPSGPCG